MATSVMTVRLDANMKRQFDSLCQQFGMSSNTAINIFVNQVVRSRSIPFTVTVQTAENKDAVRERALAALQSARERAENNDSPEMTLEEINQEIRLARLERKKRKQEDQA